MLNHALGEGAAQSAVHSRYALATGLKETVPFMHPPELGRWRERWVPQPAPWATVTRRLESIIESVSTVLARSDPSASVSLQSDEGAPVAIIFRNKKNVFAIPVSVVGGRALKIAGRDSINLAHLGPASKVLAVLADFATHFIGAAR